jgi:putative DNA primase/helicase
MTPNDFTLLKAAGGTRLTKLWKADGTLDAYDDAKNYRSSVKTVASIADLSALLMKIQSMPDVCHIRAVPKPADERALIEAPEIEGHHRRTKALCDDGPRHAICGDIDGYRPSLSDPVLDPVAAVEEFVLEHMPAEFQGISFHVQLSSSAGRPENAGVLKAHVWWWLKTPMTSEQLTHWARVTGVPLDKTAFRAVQVHYTANPVFEDGVADPVPVRSVFSAGWMGDEVDLVLPENTDMILAAAGAGDPDKEYPDARAKPGLIGAFNRAYTMDEFWEEFLPGQFERVPGSDRRVTWLGGNGAAEGAFVDASDEWLVNTHDTSPQGHRAACKWDQARIYLFGDRDTPEILADNFDVTALPSHQAMLEMTMKLPRVQAELRALHGLAVGSDFEAQVSHREAADDDVSVAQADPVSVALMQNPTQENIALIFARVCASTLRYAHVMGKWLLWDGTRWRSDDTGRAFNFAREVTRRANHAGNKSVASASFCSGVEKFAKHDPALAVRGDEFDSNHYLLNTPAGTYDLRTGEVMSHRQEDLLTKITSVAPISDGGDRFVAFLLEVTGGDQELIMFLKVALGACLSGAVEAHWIMFWTGGGRNGKNTLGDLVMFILGDYAKKIPITTLMDKGHESHPTELASLLGVRLAISSEVSDGAHWNEARINELTGDARVSARFMRQDFFEFPRTHKHLIYGNHRPQLRSITEATKSRLVIVPFKQCFAGREDPTLSDTLKAEAGFVLNWLIEGHAEWLRLGRRLPPCAAVRAETEDYFSAQSTVDMWLSESCEMVETDERAACHLPKSSELYNSYRQWKSNRGEQPMSQTRWGETMKSKFSRENSAGTRYRGLKFLTDFDYCSGVATVPVG